MRYSSLLLLAILAACGGEPPADSVYTNGKIYTVNEEQPWAEAVAIKDGRFVYVGDNAGAEELLSGDVTATDLGGRMVIPGIVDAHTHLGQIELIQYNAYFTEKKRHAFLAELEAYAQESPGEDWVLGCCWPVFEFVNGPDGPDRTELDIIFPERPVWIVSDAGHSSWLNSLALDALGLDADSPDPKFPIAMYKRDDDGRLTGWVKEGAAWQRMEEVWPTDQALHEEGMRSMLQYLSEHGVTTLYDAGNKHRNDEIYGFFAELEEAGKLPVRIEGTYRISTPDRRELAITEMKRFRKLYGGESLMLVKRKRSPP
jgi:predicted amidohydrolase YtcJ